MSSLLVFAIVVVIAVVVVPLAVFLSAPAQYNEITVFDVSFTIGYESTNHFFGPSPLTTCGKCPIHTILDHQFPYAFTLQNHDTVAHTVTEITVRYPFSLVSMTPDPSLAPVSMLAMESVTFTLTIQPTTLGGAYTLTGWIGVT